MCRIWSFRAFGWEIGRGDYRARELFVENRRPAIRRWGFGMKMCFSKSMIGSGVWELGFGFILSPQKDCKAPPPFFPNVSEILLKALQGKLDGTNNEPRDQVLSPDYYTSDTPYSKYSYCGIAYYMRNVSHN